jgi:ankyrin repeat protein
MAEPLLFVPFGNNNVFSLYKVLFTDDYSQLSWSISTMSGQSPSIGEKLKNLQRYFKKETGGDFQAFNYTNEDRSWFDKVTDLTPSIFLGLFLAAAIKIQQRKLKSSWDTVTVTGDLDYNHTTGEMKLVSVGDITVGDKGKYQAVADYASKHEGKHLFVYVSDKMEIEPGLYNNLEVKVFTGGYSVGAIIAEVFEPHFDEERTRLFEKCIVDLPWKYISTGTFKDMKDEVLSCDWKGFLIHGAGESGKSAMTFELARYLAAAERIYAPIWVRIENEGLQQEIEKPKLIIDPFKNEDALVNNPIAAYIAKAIAKTLDSDAGNDLSSLAKLIDRGNAAPYLLVIDNLELDCVIEVMNAVQIILGGVKNRSPIIITSLFDEKKSGYAQRIGLKNKPQYKAALSYDEVKSLVDAVSSGQEYEDKLKDKDREEYKVFISSVHSYFNSIPGVITQIVPLLSKRDLHKLNPLLLSMKDMRFPQEKRNAVYQVVFSQLDDFTQVVLFAFINIIVHQTFDKYINDIQVDPQEIAENIYYSGLIFTNDDDTPFELSEIQEGIPNALIELERSHLIYRTTQDSSSCKTGYSIKPLPYISFMFEESLEGKILNGKSLRDILLDSLPDIIFEGLRSNQSVSILKKYLERMKNENEKCFNYSFICVAASFSAKPEHIDLLLGFGFEINQKWSRASSRNPVQCAAAYNSNPSILQRLIKKGADYKSTDEFGRTPLHLAASDNSNPEVIALLIENDLDMYARDKNKKTPLEYAARWNPNKAIIEMFYNKEADIKKLFSDNGTLLHHAVFNKNPEIAEWLIDKGLDVNAAESGWTPLHFALLDNNTEMINLLLERGAISDINKVVDYDTYWWYPKKEAQEFYFTPLHFAAWFNKTEDNIDLLIKKGAEIDLKNNAGLTPLHFAARSNKKPDMIAFLLKHNANINEKDSKGRTPVYWAAWQNENPQVAIVLIKAGATLDDEVQYNNFLFFKKKDTARKRLKKRKDWPDIEAAIFSSVLDQNI